jgi:hypothetical protein
MSGTEKKPIAKNKLHPYSGIPYRTKKEHATDTCYDMDNLQKHKVTWKKVDIKTPYFFTIFI